MLIVIGEIIYGLAVGWLSLRLRQWAQEPRVEITLSLMTPYLAFWVPAYLGGSGVLATVACGLYVSWVGPLLIPSATRLQGIFFWDLVVYLIEGLVFLLTGLQARTLLEQGHAFSIRELADRHRLDHADRGGGAFHLGFSRPPIFRAGSVRRWQSATHRRAGRRRSFSPSPGCAASTRWPSRWPFPMRSSAAIRFRIAT